MAFVSPLTRAGELSYITEPTRNEKQTINATSASVCERRAETTPRKVIVIRNTSNDDTKIITINLGADPAVAEEGIVLRRNEAFADTTETGYQCWQGQITAICAVAAGQISIFER